MKTVNLKYAVIFLVILTVLCIAGIVFRAKPKPNDRNSKALISLGSKEKKADALVEAAYWPDFDFKDVKEFIAIPNSKEKKEFTEVVRQIINPNYLADDLSEKIQFLKGWRGKDRESFVLQYEKGPYVIRVKNQITHVQATQTHSYNDYWNVVVVQKKDQNVCVDKSKPNNILKFTDQFLNEKINSKAQNYSGSANMNKPAFKQLDTGYLLVYPVQSSNPNVGFVSIWTDGRTILINLEKRRKIALPIKRQK